MKTPFKSLAVIAGLGLLSTLWSCETTPEVESKQDILPAKFSIDIPASISGSNSTTGRIKEDSVKGNAIYLQLGTFIAVGEGASHLVEEFIQGIRQYNIERVTNLTYVSDDDGRTKNLVVFSDVSFEGRTWDYQLTVTDVDAVGQGNDGKALQIFWNEGSAVEGIAIIRPFNCDRSENIGAPNALFRIDYSEVDANGYDSHMQVSLAGLPVGNPLQDPFAMSSLKMFVGKNGDVVDVYGNSNHPNAFLFSGNTGFNYAFVASGNDAKNKGVAEVGLPPSTLNSSDRTVILKDYSITNVFRSHILAVWPNIDQAVLAGYLANTAAPGYFDDAHGFISGGVSPGADWTTLAERIQTLTPYNPSEITALQINFK